MRQVPIATRLSRGCCRNTTRVALAIGANSTHQQTVSGRKQRRQSARPGIAFAAIVERLRAGVSEAGTWSAISMRRSSAPGAERQTARAEPRAVGGLVAALAAIDARVSERLRHATERAGIRRLAAFVAHSADWWWWLIGTATLWLVGDARARPAILVVTATIVVTAITVQSLKWLVRRERPSGERDFLSRHTDPHSFPSGHAARATALTVVGAALGPP